MDVGMLLEKIIAQNDLIIRQNEKLLTLIAARTNKKDAGLLAELKRINFVEQTKAQPACRVRMRRKKTLPPAGCWRKGMSAVGPSETIHCLS